MMGAAALAFGFVAVSCSSDDDVYNLNAVNDQVVAKYQKAFVSVFGQPAANQTWGFGAPATRSVNTNANEWADPSKTYGGYLVPDPLTEAQKLRVRKYFQEHPYLTYQDPEFTDYFVQQVYKGNPETPGSLSSEQYAQATSNATPFTGSGNMDYLTFGSKADGTYFEHTNNFNGADGGMNNNVLDNGQKVGGSSHSDQIMLMLDSKTDCVGFHDSRSDTYHVTGHCALVSAAVIDAWVDSLVAAGKESIGAPVTDKWNRSFVGLDYESKPLAQAYAKNNDNSVRYAKYTDFFNSTPAYVYLGKNAEEEDVFVKWNEWEHKDEFVKTSSNKFVPCLNVNGSEILGTVEGGGKNTYCHNMNVQEYDAQNKKYNTESRQCLDLPLLQGYIDRNGMPNLKDEMKFIINPGGRDYVYSDWIVTLSQANKIDETPKPSLRVMAEDLSAEDASDFDFNDVVFDVQYVSANEVTITLQAAGGTLPLYVAGEEVHAKFIAANPGVGTDQGGTVDVHTMINTGAARINPQAPYSSAELASKPTWSYTGYSDWSNVQDTFAGQVRDQISITVDKGKGPIVLTAETGKAPSKIGLANKLQWALERTNVKNAFNFDQWVQNPNITLTATAE